ncbi:ATP-binding protein [Microbacterium sp. LRZ72]|uniref:sensor histidine kinase n=1 Tax=Microbacterium sp. LRZ72 TaxID=2942481 RepID=UPI0029BAA49D|nr:ATP-binding protein [Microbacterium sp. LRZ72]MDX2375934.1 ATP-binding protein [Microbacterium sp. LRZ72]
MAILIVGLFASGIATLGFVRNALIAGQNEQLEDRARSDLAAGLLEATVDEETGNVEISLTDEAAAGDYYVAVYDPDGPSLGSVPVEGGPVWPEEFSLEETYTRGTTPFVLTSAEGAVFHASAGTLDLERTLDIELGGKLYTQVIALPLRPIDQTVAVFFGAFTILGVVTVFAGALLTRLLVTQTFRPLGQVERAAISISAGDFGQRLVPGDPRTEVGKLTGALNTMLDRVDASISQREQTVRQMRRFIGDASHELRTPLVTVRGYAELYRMGAIRGEEDTSQAMERIEKEAIRMGGMVEDLLALARLDERREVAITPVDLRPIARDAAMDVRAAAPGRTVTVIDRTALPPRPPAPTAVPSDADATAATETGTGDQDAGATRPRTRSLPLVRRRSGAAPDKGEPSPRRSLLKRLPRPQPAARDDAGISEPAGGSATADDTGEVPMIALPPVVRGDEDRIRQVIANLLGNARRFTSDDTPIELTVGTSPERTSEHAPLGLGWIAISDHGEGVPEQIREHIFERFWRADTSRTRETGGTGLGLAIVASIVDALHGSVRVDDTPGGGATFTVAFPLAPESTLYVDTQPLPKLRGPAG